jgi:glycosyltransferase involved in cell wall biosynthesis
MNVLLITFSFPPAGGVGVLRALSLAKYLPEYGVHVDVLTARNAPAVGRDESLLKQVPASVTVHRTWTLDLPFALRKGLKKLLMRKAASPAPARNAAAKPGLLGRVKNFIANLLLPDPQIGWLPFAAPAARRLIRRRKIDAVLITVPPFSSVKLATKLRRTFPTLPIVVDFRDEWLTTTLQLVSFNANAKARRIAEKTEREAVHAATRVVLVTEAAVEEIRSRYPNEPREKFLAIPNGYETPAQPYAPVASRADERITLTYMGTVYGSTDPLTTVAAINQLAPEIRSRLKIRFIGHVETDRYREALSSVPEVVELAGFMPQAKALEALRASHYALLITHDPINVSAKFYDYLGTGIPIVAAVNPAGDVRRLLERTRAGWWADSSDAGAIAALLTDAVQRASSGAVAFTPDRDAVAQYHRRPLAARYAALLHELHKTGPQP